MHLRGFFNAFHNRDMSDDEVFDDWMEDVNDSPIDALPDREMVKELLKKCRGLISMIKRSTIITAFFDMLRTKLNIRRNLCYHVKTRWNSTFCLMDIVFSRCVKQNSADSMKNMI